MSETLHPITAMYNSRNQPFTLVKSDSIVASCQSVHVCVCAVCVWWWWGSVACYAAGGAVAAKHMPNEPIASLWYKNYDFSFASHIMI